MLYFIKYAVCKITLSHKRQNSFQYQNYDLLKWAQEVDNYNEAGLVKNKKKQISLCGFYSIAMMMNGTQLRFMFW